MTGTQGAHDCSLAALIDRTAQGDAEAQYQLGTLYHTGRGVEQDYARAAEQYAKAAVQGAREGTLLRLDAVDDQLHLDVVVDVESPTRN